MRPILLFVLAQFVVIPAAGETHRLVPSVFHSTYSSAHAPVLRIKNGDRIVTSIVDDMGVDGRGHTVATGPNPQAGPFFVEGAEPGDLLVVTIETLEPNRDRGTSAAVIAANAVAPGAFAARGDNSRVQWTIDSVKRVVRLDLQTVGRTGWRSRFESPAFELPLAPTLGSIAVAPAGHDAISTTSAGPFGGNMIAGGAGAGARIMLPVFHPGALLYLGHGHARQGDGAVSGTGVETSLDIEISVDLVKKKEWPHSSVVRPSTVVGEFEQGWPRVETSEYLMTVGTGPSLLVALQRATVELHHWLDDDFGLSERAVNIFVGQAIEYEITSVADSSAVVVAKVRKAYLPRAASP